MKKLLFQVDAFTLKPFSGNPAVVLIMDKEQPNGWMAAFAAEMNLSETAFLLPLKGGNYSLRWFTPEAEVNLCGHATLASAHILWEKGYLPAHQEAIFETRSGILRAVKKGDWIEMDFPSYAAKKVPLTDDIKEILGGSPKAAYTSGEDLMIVYEDEHEITKLAPDLLRMAELPFRGVIVTVKSDGKPYDFISRFFGPRVGVNEDPVTGSAHSSLCPFWSKQLGKQEMLAKQVSKRGGVLKVRDMGKRVAIAGQAVTILKGELDV